MADNKIDLSGMRSDPNSRFLEVYDQIMRASSQQPQQQVYQGPNLVDRSGMRQLSGMDKIMSRVGDVGDAIVGLSGFGENWAELKDRLATGRFDAGQALRTAGSFIANIPLGMASAPFSAASGLYEWATGRPVNENEGDWIPDYKLSQEQRNAELIDSGIDLLGLFAGGTGAVLRTGKGVLKAGKTAAKAAADATAKMPFKATAATRIAYEAAEEGAEEFVQSLAEDVRGTQNEHGLTDDSFAKALEAAALGAAGGALMGGFVEGVQKIGEKVQTKAQTTGDPIIPLREPEGQVTVYDSGEAGLTPIIGVQDEALKDKAKVRENASTVSGRGFFRNHLLKRIDNIIWGWDRLRAALLQESEPDASNTAISDFFASNNTTYTLSNGSQGTLLEAMNEVHNMLNDPRITPAAVDAQANRVIAEINQKLADGNNDLELYATKPPGDQPGFVRVHLQAIVPENVIYLTNILGKAINSDVDGDVFQTFAQKRRGPNKQVVGVSIWQALSTITGKPLDERLQGNLVYDIPAVPQQLKDLWNVINPNKIKQSIGISTKAEFEELVDWICKYEFGNKQETEAAANWFKSGKKDYLYPNTVFGLFTAVYNNSSDKNSASDALSSAYSSISLSSNQSLAMSSDPNRRIEEHYGIAARAAVQDLASVKPSVDPVAQAYAVSQGVKEAYKIEPREGFIVGKENFLNAIIDLFRGSESIFSITTRLNLSMLYQIKSLAENVYTSASVGGSYIDAAKGKRLVLNSILLKDANVWYLGGQPMDETTALIRSAVMLSAEQTWMAGGHIGRPSSQEEFEDFVDNHFKKAWEDGKKTWDSLKTNNVNGFLIPDQETAYFPEITDDNKYLCLFDTIKDKTYRDVSSSGSVHEADNNVTFESAVAGLYKTGQLRGSDQTFMWLVRKMAAAARDDARKTQSLIERRVDDTIKRSGKTLKDFHDADFDIDRMTPEQVVELNNIVQGFYSYSRVRDFHNMGWYYCEDVYRALRDPDNVGYQFARGLFSLNREDVFNAIATLANYNQFNGVRGLLDRLISARQRGADVQTLNSIIDELQGEIARMIVVSPFHARICEALNVLCANGDIVNNDERLNQIIDDINTFCNIRTADGKVSSFQFKKNRIKLMAEGEDISDTFLIDSITKEIDKSDIQTPKSRFRNYSRWFDVADKMAGITERRDYIVNLFKGSVKSRTTAPLTPDKIADRIGAMYESDWFGDVSLEFAVTLSNQARFSTQRSRKTTTPPAADAIWSTFTRQDSQGAMTSNLGSIAFQASSFSWNDILRNPSLLGRMAFTDFIEDVAKDKNAPHFVKIVLSDGTVVYVKNKFEFLRLFVPKSQRSSLFANNTWDADSVETLLTYSPGLVEIFNPISYSVVERNGAASIQPSHRHSFDTELKKGNLVYDLSDEGFKKGYEDARINAQVLRSVLKDQHGAALLYSMISDSVYENAHDFKTVARETETAINNFIKFWRVYLQQPAGEARERFLARALGTSYKEYAKVIASSWASKINTELAKLLSNYGQAELLDFMPMAQVQRQILDMDDEVLAFTQESMQKDLKDELKKETDTFNAGINKILTEDLSPAHSRQIEDIVLLSLLSRFSSGNIDSAIPIFQRSIDLYDEHIKQYDIIRRELSVVRNMKNSYKTLEDFFDAASSYIDNLHESDTVKRFLNIELENMLDDKYDASKMNQAIFSAKQKMEAAKRRYLELSPVAESISDSLPEIGNALIPVIPKVSTRSGNIKKFSYMSRCLSSGHLKLFMRSARPMAEEISKDYGVSDKESLAALIKAKTQLGPGDTLVSDMEALEDLMKDGKKSDAEKQAGCEKLFKEMICLFVARGNNRISIDQYMIEESLHTVADRISRELPGRYDTPAETSEEVYDLVSSGKISFTVKSELKRTGISQAVSEIGAGNVNTGVSMDASPRVFMTVFTDMPAHIKRSSAENLTSDENCPAYYTDSSKVVAKYNDLMNNMAYGENGLGELICGTYVDATGFVGKLTPAKVVEWSRLQQPIPLREARFLDMPNAGFDERFSKARPDFNSRVPSIFEIYNRLTIVTAEAMALQTKKKGGQFSSFEYSIDDAKGRRDLQVASYKSSTWTTNVDIIRKEIVDAVQETKRVFATACSRNYMKESSPDKARSALNGRISDFYELANYLIQRIIIITDDGDHISLSWNDILGKTADADPDNGWTQLQALVSSGNISGFKVDIMTVEELCSELIRTRRAGMAAYNANNPNNQIDLVAAPGSANNATRNGVFSDIFEDYQLQMLRRRTMEDPYEQIRSDILTIGQGIQDKWTGIRYSTIDRNNADTDQAQTDGAYAERDAREKMIVDAAKSAASTNSNFPSLAQPKAGQRWTFGATSRQGVIAVKDLSSNSPGNKVLEDFLNEIVTGRADPFLPANSLHACVVVDGRTDTSGSPNVANQITQAINLAQNNNIWIAIRSEDKIAIDEFFRQKGIQDCQLYIWVDGSGKGWNVYALNQKPIKPRNQSIPDVIVTNGIPPIYQLYSSVVPRADGGWYLNRAARERAAKIQYSPVSGEARPLNRFSAVSPDDIPGMLQSGEIDIDTNVILDPVQNEVTSTKIGPQVIKQAVSEYFSALNGREAGSPVRVHGSQIICVGLSQAVYEGSVRFAPVLIEQPSNAHYTTCTVVYNGAKRSWSWIKSIDTADAVQRGELEKLLGNLGLGGKGMSGTADYAEMIFLDPQRSSYIPMAISDVTNNYGKTASSVENVITTFYHEVKYGGHSLFFDFDSSGMPKIKDSIHFRRSEDRELLFNVSRQNELCTAICDGDISFDFGNETDNERFNNLMKRIATECYGKNNFLEHFSAFVWEGSGNTLLRLDTFETTPTMAFPDDLEVADIVYLFNKISPETFGNMPASYYLSKNGYKRTKGFFPKYDSQGFMLYWAEDSNGNLQPHYDPCRYENLIIDHSMSATDSFYGASKYGEKPQSTTAFMYGRDDNSDYTALRVEQDLAVNMGLGDAYRYYHDPSRRQVAPRGDTRERDAAFMNQIGINDMLGSREYSEANAMLRNMRGIELRRSKEEFDRQHIFFFDDKGSPKNIWASDRAREIKSQIIGMFNDNVKYSDGDWNFTLETLVKKSLSWSPNMYKSESGQNTFSEKEILHALEKIYDSLSHGTFFWLETSPDSGIDEFTLYQDGKSYRRFILPFLSDTEISLLQNLRSGVRTEQELRELSIEQVKTFIRAMKTSPYSSVQRRSIFSLIDSLTQGTYADGEIDTGWIKDGYYIDDLLRSCSELLEHCVKYQNIEPLRALSEQNKKRFEREILNGRTRGTGVLYNQYGEGGMSTHKIGAPDTTITKIMNHLCEINKMMRVLEPLLLPASIVERLGYTSPHRFMLINGIEQDPGDGSYNGVYRSNVRRYIGDSGASRIVQSVKNISEDTDMRTVFGNFKIANLFQTTAWLMDDVDRTSDISSLITSKLNQSTLERISTGMFDFMSGRGIGQPMQIEVFFDNLIRLMSLDDRFSWYFQTDENGITNIERYINNENAARFFMKCFANDSPLREVAGMAMNVAMRGDAAQKTIFSTIFYEFCAQHQGAKFFVTTLFSPFMQYGWNISMRHFNAIFPVSSLNYLLCRLGSTSAIPIPGLKFNGEQATSQNFNWSDAQLAASLREALMMDLAHMGAVLTAALILGLPGALEPPDDDDLWCNVEEWTFLGQRIKANWWIEDLLGPTLAYACVVKSCQLGKPSPQTFVKSMSKLMFSNPLMKFSDVVNLVFNPYGQYMDAYYEDIERYSDNMDGEQTALQVLGDNIGINTLEYVFQFVTPSILRQFYQNTQPYEVSYKNIYQTDIYGNRSSNYVEKAQHWEQKMRQACRNNPWMALLANLTTGGGASSGDTGFWAWDMPRTVYWDPEQLDSYDALSLYYTDETGKQIMKSEQEQQAIALGILCKLIAYDDMSALRKTGFAIPKETMAYVGDMIWDIIWENQQAFDELVKSSNFDPYMLGAGDVEAGRKIIEGYKASLKDTFTFWRGVYYNKLYSPEMKQGAVGYNRLSTEYAQDANGNWYATGFRKSIPNMILPFKLASGTVDAPGPTAGRDEGWATPSLVTGNPMTDEQGNPMRVLVPADSEWFKTPDLDSLGGNGDGTGYSKSYPRSGYGRSGSGGGSGYWPSTPRMYAPSTPNTRLQSPTVTTRSNRPISNVDLNAFFIRPGFETKGSRKAYKREDI